MSKFNFDPEYFRRVISQCNETEKIAPLWLLFKEAVEAFYNEYDYYPDTGVFAPGVFTIMGDHLEYLDGNLVQAALPLVTVIVGKALNTVKCKVVTTASDVGGLKRMVFPINYFKNSSLKIFPPWLTYIKGIITHFPCKNLKGFDVLIHSNVPIHPGCGRSAALQVAFYTFLEAICGKIKNKEKKGEICRKAELDSQNNCTKIGQWCNMTSSIAEGSVGVILNCQKHEVSKFHLRDINILFLLTYLNFDLEINDRDLIPQRQMELHVAATLLGLKHIKFATEKHLEIMENMEDPTRETVESILRRCNIEEKCIEEFVTELFYFPPEEFVGEGDEHIYHGEESVKKSEITDYAQENEMKGEEEAGEFISDQDESQNDKDKKEACPTCLQPSGFIPTFRPKEKDHPMDFIHEKVAELCEGKEVLETPPVVKSCEQINCLGGLENLSLNSNTTVMGKLLRRVRHVITEKLRCTDISDFIKKGDYVQLGTKLIHSHFSLKLDYEVSCPTLDNMVKLAINTEGVYGSKMISGGGTLTLLHRHAVEKLIKKIKKRFGPCLRFYLVFPSPGANIVKMAEKNNEKTALSAFYLNKTELMKRAVKSFETTYKHKATHGAFAPCVLNLIGDHLDYNHGFTISMATSILTVVVGALNCTSRIRVATNLNVGEEPSKVSFYIPDVQDLGPGNVNWAKLIRGVVVHFKGAIKGFDCVIDGNIPYNVKLSSNTALAVSFYTFLEELFNVKTDLQKKVSKCMFAEHEFLSLLKGSGNHTVAVKAKKDFFALLDCKSMKITHIPFNDLSVCMVVTFTGSSIMVNRALLYARGEECYKVAKSLGAKTLRCLTLKDLEALEPGKISEKGLKRATHVISENERALKCAEALKNNDFFTVGELMVASHNSLSYNYEVTNEDLNQLVKLALEVDGVMGSGMPGTEQPACIMTLVTRWAVDDLIEYLQDNYSGTIESYVVTTHESCGPLNIKEYMETVMKSQMIFEKIYTV